MLNFRPAMPFDITLNNISCTWNMLSVSTTEPISCPRYSGVHAVRAPATRTPLFASFLLFFFPLYTSASGSAYIRAVLSLLASFRIIARSCATALQTPNNAASTETITNLFILFSVLKYITRLAVKRLAQCVKSAETHSLGLPGFEYRKVRLSNPHLLGKFARGHLALGKHYINIYYNRHNFLLYIVRLFSSLTLTATLYMSAKTMSRAT